MAVNALLMCRDAQALKVVAAALDELGIEEEMCVSAPQAMELMAQGYYSALVVDFDLPTASAVVRTARLAPPQRRAVVFAMIGAHTDVASTFQSGANFVLYKPVTLSQVLRSLRAGRVFMRADRRRSPRHKVETLVYLRFGDEGPLPAIVLDLNERGLAVQAAEPLPAAEVPLRFILPGTEYLIEGKGDVIWADDSCRAGIFFTDLSASSRKQLKNWMAKRSGKRSRARVPSRAPLERAPATTPN